MNQQPTEIAWGDVVKGLSLGISLQRPPDNSGEKSVVLEIFIANRSAEKIKIVESNVLLEYDIEVTRDGGLPVPMTAVGKEALEATKNLEIRRRIVVEIEPGDVHKVTPPVKLDEWFQLDERDAYAVRVRRKDWQSDEGPLASGVATFAVR